MNEKQQLTGLVSQLRSESYSVPSHARHGKRGGGSELCIVVQEFRWPREREEDGVDARHVASVRTRKGICCQHFQKYGKRNAVHATDRMTQLSSAWRTPSIGSSAKTGARGILLMHVTSLKSLLSSFSWAVVARSLPFPFPFAVMVVVAAVVEEDEAVLDFLCFLDGLSMGRDSDRGPRWFLGGTSARCVRYGLEPSGLSVHTHTRGSK